MPWFRLNAGYDEEARDIEAERFVEEGSFVVFLADTGEQVYAIPTGSVYTIERISEEHPD